MTLQESRSVLEFFRGVGCWSSTQLGSQRTVTLAECGDPWEPELLQVTLTGPLWGLMLVLRGAEEALGRDWAGQDGRSPGPRGDIISAPLWAPELPSPEFPLSCVLQVKSEGPKLVPFFKATCVYFVLWLPSSSPSWVSALIKCLPIFCLWVFLLAHGLGFLLAHPSATRIFVGLVFSALGDAFLIWQDQGYFVHGLLMFAVTHLLYSSAFGMRPLALRTGLVLAVLSGLFYALLYPGLTGAFTYLVGVYVALISFMGWRAMAGLRLVGAAWRWTELAAGSGALLFIVSDMTIALDKFCFPVPYSRALIMSTYYAAQMLIALSAVESREPVEDCKLSKAN
ncbi:lysoplasmalogenase-like protein TMEM86A [Tupaia chinensis]|uniref:lysoplasmalogenase-like protein TMEM86A n=1 Tax=Tupaia chinensis TaxID=246437 RepID=UPI000704271B|nr:lysoplasmalogenase-like protein TMEM86A [Tupaia chinensis]